MISLISVNAQRTNREVQKCRCYSICRSSFGWACLRSRRTKCGSPSKSRRYGKLDDDRKRKQFGPSQGTRHSDWPACRSSYGADLRKGNHLVYRLSTLIAATGKRLRDNDESSHPGNCCRVFAIGACSCRLSGGTLFQCFG